MQDPPHDESGDGDDSVETHLHRRRVLALGAGLGVTMLAGCSSGSDPSSTTGNNQPEEAAPTADSSPTAVGGDGSATTTGAFRLLISDQPVAIGEFDELNVSFDRARVFRGDAADEEKDDAEAATATETDTGTEAETETETATETATETETETATDTATPTETETETAVDDEADGEPEGADEEANADGEADDNDERGFFVIDLDGATVDLTQVVGKKAIGVFDGELAAGRYTKIELYAAGVEGIVNGDEVEVKIPSGKLQIVKPFDVVPGQTVTFVFDINVVKKGNTGAYNLLPVISESGVAGEDVEVEEVDDDEDEETEDPEDEDDGSEETDTEEPETETTETDEPDEDEQGDGGGQGPPDDAGNNG